MKFSFVLAGCFALTCAFGQVKESAADSVNLDLKNISTQLVNLRDSIGLELMAMDKRLMRAPDEGRVTLEKSKCKLNIYKAELEKLIEEVAIADISYITDVKKRSFRTVRDVRREFLKVLAETKSIN